MPWRVTSPMYQRQRFVLDAEHTPGTFAGLCRRYRISRKTGYNRLERNARLEPESLSDRSHRPRHCPHARPYPRDPPTAPVLALGRPQVETFRRCHYLDCHLTTVIDRGVALPSSILFPSKKRRV
jgi:hypothetical protein